MMKIVLIHGQNHKGSTWNVADILVQNMNGEKDVKEFFLPRDLNHFCAGCYSCLEGRDNCPFGKIKSQLMAQSRKRICLYLQRPIIV